MPEEIPYYWYNIILKNQMKLLVKSACVLEKISTHILMEILATI